jgi:hypothetical protein
MQKILTKHSFHWEYRKQNRTYQIETSELHMYCMYLYVRWWFSEFFLLMRKYTILLVF